MRQPQDPDDYDEDLDRYDDEDEQSAARSTRAPG
jgi:hypothetical protein